MRPFHFSILSILGLVIFGPASHVHAGDSHSGDDAEKAVFFRGLNLNGPAVVIDGYQWDGKDSKDYVCKDSAFEAQQVKLIPSTDAQRAKMIRSSRWNGNRVLLKNIPKATMTVFLYVWEDNNPETYEIHLNGKMVVSQFNSGTTGQWQRLGPWYVDVDKQAIEITSKGGAANFSGIEIWRGKHDGNNDPPITDEQLAFFEQSVRPLLAKHCYECHSSQSEELQGGLLVDSRPTLRRGGDNGPAIVPGDADHSLLIRAVRYEPGMEMPPDEKLSDAEIDVLQRWVNMGAPDPRTEATRYVRRKFDVDKARQFWSLRPLTDPTVPQPKDQTWSRNEIDRFIAVEREQAKLQPVADADKHTLIRRATYDLIGLPPSPDEERAFADDDSPDAFAKVIDRLLDSPHYGERWGRHWMDLVRYADTAGDNSDYPIPQAYLYRNYIIDSINADKPYDQFLREQIAGDLLPAETDEQRNEQTIATGYLAISRRFGSVIDNYPQHLTIEDSLDNIGRTMLAMTITCARCHDHKFDPISQDDYYGLYGIFQSTQYPFPGIELDKKPRDFVPLVENGRPSDKLVYAMAEGSVEDAAVHLRGDPDKTGDVVPRRFLEVLGGQLLNGDELKQSGRLQLANWLTAPENPLTARVMVNRMWQYHFGSGLVKTSNDFGIRGTPPTHPELLDWLASRFIDDGWSMKKMHRRMMLSRTYQLSSRGASNTAATRQDPNNDLRWRFDRQQLDAESLRDTMMLLSGELELQMPRTPHPFPPTEKWQFTQHHPFRDSYDSNKRSVYLMMARLNARPFFTTFDGADQNACTAVRDSSVTTLQSLYLMNDEFVHDQAGKIASRLLESSDDRDERLTYAFELTFGRPPRSSERQNASEWLSSIDEVFASGKVSPEKRESEIWTALVRSLLRTNEFLYVD
ncbi:PSD1 and planctomycete cytochrome C domain-containing protein [Stieleria varia]|uniref:PSD1 and planctomycete cytochrome C domain-containing protein n=1 Tax=Stieleria varia TaxID=2528005 RepID=UPI001E2FBFAF|nr:PSD1 and planctomycete cytochrome C domain-containing protein [Stieleria varia]